MLFGIQVDVRNVRDVMWLRHCSDSCCPRSAVGRGLSGVGEITGFPTSWRQGSDGQPDYLGSLGRGNMSVIAPVHGLLCTEYSTKFESTSHMPVATAEISDWLFNA